MLISTPLPGNKITLGHKRQQIVLALRFVELSPLVTKSSAIPPADISSTKYFQINWLLDTIHDRIMRTWNTMEHACLNANGRNIWGYWWLAHELLRKFSHLTTFFYQHKYDTKSYAHTIECIYTQNKFFNSVNLWTEYQPRLLIELTTWTWWRASTHIRSIHTASRRIAQCTPSSAVTQEVTSGKEIMMVKSIDTQL